MAIDRSQFRSGDRIRATIVGVVDGDQLVSAGNTFPLDNIVSAEHLAPEIRVHELYIDRRGVVWVGASSTTLHRLDDSSRSWVQASHIPNLHRAKVVPVVPS